MTDATYRQLDWWDRNGLYGPYRSVGSGGRRSFSFPEAVLTRAWVLAAALGARQRRCYMDTLHTDIVLAYEESPRLTFYWLVLEPHRATIQVGSLTWVVPLAAIVVDLEGCASYVYERADKAA
jgi:hypothetical protein